MCVYALSFAKEVKPLPKDILDFMEGAEHGVVLLTMGMTYVPSDIPPHLERELIKAFSRLKQRVVMKLTDVPPNLPANILVKKWLPQQSILAHPKVMLMLKVLSGPTEFYREIRRIIMLLNRALPLFYYDTR